MNRSEALQTLRNQCNLISSEITRMHPVIPTLEHPQTQSEILKALFELTKQVEVVKKHLIRLEKSDDSTLL